MLTTSFPIGEYRGTEGNRAIQSLFRIYETELAKAIPRLASRPAAEFLLFQFDEATRILHGNTIQDLKERAEWELLEGVFRRALKYLVELMCLDRPSETSTESNEGQIRNMSVAMACAEFLAGLAELSERVHAIVPDQCTVIISDHGASELLTVKIDRVRARFDERFLERVKRDRISRSNYVDDPQFDLETATHQRWLDEAFSESYGISYGEMIFVLYRLIEDSVPAPGEGFPTLFILKSQIVSQLGKLLNKSPSAIERALAGFSISADLLELEERAIWKPKQKYRAHRRGLFQFPHETGEHLAFSRSMAKETLMQLCGGICYQHVPDEWRCNKTNKAVRRLSNAASDWFEDVVARNLVSIGFTGGKMARFIGSNSEAVRIPDSVGELDFVGYNDRENLIVLIEAKMSQTGLDARHWRDDLDRFLNGKKPYRDQFLRKLDWVSKQRAAIVKCLGGNGPCEVAGAIVTLYPCIVDEFIEGFRCVSLTELMLDYERAKVWPYQLTPS